MKAATVLAILVLAVVCLVYAKPFLVPLTFAALLAMLLLPVSRWLQRKGVGKAVAILLSMSLLLIFVALVVFFISWQVSDLASNASNTEQQITAKYQQAQQFVAEKLGIPPAKQKQMVKQQQSQTPGKLATLITGFLGGLGGFLADTLLVLVYIFLLSYFRSRLKTFLVWLVPDSEEGKAVSIVNDAQQVAQKYLSGMSLMIVSLWVMYGIGFSVAGIPNAILFAIICGLLEIIPFVGNLTGTLITLTVALAQGGGTQAAVGVLVTYAVVQFIQTYLLEPLVVGANVSINPLFTIMGLVAGELVWGISGMVLAIPLLGITKIVCDHIEPLKPYGYLMGQDEDKGSGFGEKLKQLWAKVTGKETKQTKKAGKQQKAPTG
jgi:predicted PurR-regulated permease PerM